MSGKLNHVQEALIGQICARNESEEKPIIGDLRIQPMEGFTFQECLNVYRRGYIARIVESMAQDYRAVLRVVGGVHFERIVRDYLLKFPPSSANLMDTGGSLPAYLMADHDTLDRFEFLPQLAALEWTIYELGCQERQVPVDWNSDIQTLTMDQWITASLQPSPNIRSLPISWNVDEIWRQATENGNSSDEVLQVAPEHGILLLTLGENGIHFEKLVGSTESLWQEMLNASSILDLCERVQESGSLSPEAFLELARRWLSLDVIRICHL